MKTLLGVFRCEYGMSIRRLSLWLSFGILMVPHLTSMLLPPSMVGQIPAEDEVLSFAATFAFLINLFMPVVGGILIADRLVRDRKIGVDELISSTPLNRGTYLAGKYLGALFSIVTPVLLCSFLFGVSIYLAGGPFSIIPAALLMFLSMNFPAYVFVTAFSLGVPLIIPVRVYQVLFTGYWFWGNFISPTVMLTLNGTYLTANGYFVLLGFFGSFYGGGGPDYGTPPTHVDAYINLAVLAAFTALALFASDRYLAWQASRA